MKLRHESDILKESFRSKVIKEIKGTENVTRKNYALRRYEVFRDRIKKWVIESLTKEGLKEDTLLLMETRAANISVCKKVVKKLARAYSNGVDREVQDNISDESIEELAREMDFNAQMKKTDQYVQLFKNTMVGVLPQENTRESEMGSKKYDLKVKVMPPYSYDVIEDIVNAEVPRVVILSEFVDRNKAQIGIPLQAEDGRQIFGNILPQFDQGDGVDQIIADNPDDAGRGPVETFIWWTEHYHFTTDENGKILPDKSPPDGANPIQMMPFVNFAEDQDGNFWAQGGDDLIDGAILLNKLLTDLYSIAFHQGWGQMVITGKDIPKDIPVGPRKALILEHQSTDDPAPSVNYASANPPLGDWMSMMEQYTALLLSTNNLSPTTVSGKLDAVNPASGIARLIDQSESTADVRDRQRLFIDNEPIIWEIIRVWHDRLHASDSLTKCFADILPFKDSDVKLEFKNPQPILTEADRIANIKARKDLGLDTLIDLMKELHPGMNDDEAMEKLAEIQLEKLQRMAMFKVPANNPQSQQGLPGQTQDMNPATAQSPVPTDQNQPMQGNNQTSQMMDQPPKVELGPDESSTVQNGSE